MGNNRLIGLRKNGIKIVLLFLILLLSGPLQGQPRTQRKIERREAALDRKERKAYEKRRKVVLKHRYNIQTKKVQARMKASKKKADQFNKGLKEPFLKTLFKRKRNPKRKKRPR